MLRGRCVSMVVVSAMTCWPAHTRTHRMFSGVAWSNVFPLSSLRSPLAPSKPLACVVDSHTHRTAGASHFATKKASQPALSMTHCFTSSILPVGCGAVWAHVRRPCAHTSVCAPSHGMRRACEWGHAGQIAGKKGMWGAMNGFVVPAQMAMRCMHVRGKSGESAPGTESRAAGDESNTKEEKDRAQNAGEAEAEADGEDGAAGRRTGQTAGHGRVKPKMTFMQHIRGIRNDYASFPDIYSGANFVNFIIFTVFCLCSTGSNTEEVWWMRHWTVDNSFMPHAWLLHSCLTNNFLSMAYAMMMLHSMCHLVLPTIGSRGLLGYTAATAIISGAIIWLGNRLAYGADGKAHEKQFGPWDVLSAMFVIQYLHFGITPMTTLNSFNSWMRYACWTGQLCIMYFDWQPTFVGALVGLALCRGVPRFRPKPLTNA